jgi:hypothetical protein
MATYDIPLDTDVTRYDTASGTFTGYTTTGFTVQFDDNDAGDDVFDTSETLDVIINGSLNGTATYVGLVEVDGATYPAFAFSSGETFIFGVRLEQPTYENFSTLTLDTSDFTVCFAAGTRIATPSGEVAVEDLTLGSLILTAEGRAVPVKWIGRQTVSTRFAGAGSLRMVRIAAGALGAGLPLRNLVVTADHALVLDGLLVNAGALVNGTTIAPVPVADLGERHTIYHVETEAHDVILAEGVPAETYVDYVGRRVFDNHAEYLALYGEDKAMPEMNRPRITSARMLPATLRARLGIDAAA